MKLDCCFIHALIVVASQSLLVPFAFLITKGHRDTILDLLESTNVDGRSGLDIWIQTWCENAETFQGLWAMRVSSLALCDLLVCDRPTLRTLVVKGDIIVKPQTQNGQYSYTVIRASD